MTPPGGENGITSLPVSQIKSLKWHITRKCYEIEQKSTLITNRSAIASQNLLFYLTCDATWRRSRRSITSGFIEKSLSSRKTWKRYVIEQKLTLITIRKLAIAFPNLPFYLTYDSTCQRNRRYISSDFMINALNRA